MSKKSRLRLIVLGPEDQTLGQKLRQLWVRLWSKQEGRPGLEWLALALLGALVAMALTPLPWGRGVLPRMAGLALLAALLLRVVYRSWFRTPPARLSRPRLRDLAFLSGLTLLVAVVAKGYFVFTAAVAQGWLGTGAQALAFGAPLCAAPLLVSLFLGSQAALLMALITGFLASFLWSDAGGAFAYFIFTGMVAVQYAEGGHTRATLIRAGTRSALTGLMAILALSLLRGWFWSLDLLVALPVAVLGGLLGGVLAAGLSPLMEMAFGYTSTIRLMELGSLDHPILRDLMMQAPGTYHHSLVVGSLVEAAAREIGANHLLAKVAALYHDIGKIKKAGYFIENQRGGKNPHEKLAPSMSALILISHVKEGVELARRHRLGQPLIDIMGQHHGTRLIAFFYHKASECRAKVGQPLPDEQNFRYPGPKPQTREAGLVMLADVAEAACRSLDNPSPARITKLVQDQVSKVFTEGQLDECELTLKDLHKIAKIFNTILTGIFHQRVEYPQAEAERGPRQDGDTDNKPARGAAAQPGPAQPPDPANLRRLGIGRG